MVLRALNGDWEMLFIKRAEHPDDPWSGHMALPGGRLDPQDADPLEAARRETTEEVGVDLQRSGRHLGQLDDVRPSRASRSLVITPHVFELCEPVDPRPNEREVDEIHWVRGSQLRDPELSSTCVWRRGEERYELPCFRVNDRVIWGLTYRMLMSLFSALDWPLPATAVPRSRRSR